MVSEIKEHSQITIPDEIIKKMGIGEGDKFEVMEKDGGIFLCPVVVYPKESIEKIKKVIDESEIEMQSKKQFRDIDSMFDEIGIKLDNV